MNRAEFVAILDRALELLEKTEVCTDQRSKLHALKGRLESKELVVSVFGQFKRGKSTLINSMLGEDVLPVGVVPVTSVITRIRYGEKGAAVTSGEGTFEIPLDQLAQYVSEQNNPGNEKGVLMVQITFPSTFLSSGVTLVDTPGVGSMHRYNSEAAYAFVKDSDAVVFVLSVDSPINEIERGFLEEIRKFAPKIYLAVNKTDLLAPGELSDYVGYCGDLLRRIMETDQIRLYPVHARDKSDPGLLRLMADIASDVNSSCDEILLASARIKASCILREALGNVRLYVSALKMPLVRLEETALAMGEKLAFLEQMAKEACYLINQRTDSLLEEIRSAFEGERLKIGDEIAEKIEEVYEEEKSLRPGALEKKLKDALEAELAEKLAALNDKGVSMLREGYESASKIFAENLKGVHRYLRDVIRELFGVEYSFSTEDYTLSEANDYYVRVDIDAPSMFFEGSDLVRLLPKARANRIILRRILRKAQEAVELNVADMLSNCAYKIRESNRYFRADFTRRAKELGEGFREFIERTVSERKKSGGEAVARIAAAQEVCSGLARCLELISSNGAQGAAE